MITLNRKRFPKIINTNVPRTARDIPELIEAVLIQATKLHFAGAIPSSHFNAQLKRLLSEELLPRGFSMEIETTPSGRSRIILKEKEGGTICRAYES
ncbi:MAG TPA: hypothetical protein VHY22_15745 [Chthoniobacteraceae bacterium]|jgi:hypothetical protein|nr:hypothetical protein [Chthoniobacteraceae bacterium]